MNYCGIHKKYFRGQSHPIDKIENFNLLINYPTFINFKKKRICHKCWLSKNFKYF
jgi:hypothetical protein